MFKVYTNLYSLAKSMVTLFPRLYKFTYVSFGYVCVHKSRAHKLLFVRACVCTLALYVAQFRNYLQSSTMNKVIKVVDFYRHVHGIAGCHV